MKIIIDFYFIFFGGLIWSVTLLYKSLDAAIRWHKEDKKSYQRLLLSCMILGAIFSGLVATIIYLTTKI
jgi:hypothetical protein